MGFSSLLSPFFASAPHEMQPMLFIHVSPLKKKKKKKEKKKKKKKKK
jgi:hypothetical protein